MHGYFVVCSDAAPTSGCVAVESEFPGFGTLQLAQSVNGQPLTSAETIEAGIRAGVLVALDTTAVFVGNISPAR
jgi:hypothetical protein